MTQQQCIAASVLARCTTHCSVLLYKTGSKQPCVTATAPVKICCSDMCAVTQHQCTAALVLARCTPHCSVLLCKTGSQQPCVTAFAPVKICCSDSFATGSQQPCDPTAMHCSICSGKLHHPLLSAALQNRLEAALWHCNCTCKDLLFRQVCRDPAPMQNRLTAGLCQCSYTYGDLLSYRCAESHQNCTAALVWVKCIPNCSVVLCKTGSQQACVNATTPIEICSHTGVQRANRNALQHWSGQIALPTVQLCSAKQAHSRLVSMHLHLWRFALI